MKRLDIKKNKIKSGKINIFQSIFKTFFLSLALIATVHFAYAQQGGIIPNGKTTFLDNNGKPLSSGKVFFFTQGTTTPKTTFQDINQTIPNVNPVVLDAAGRALIWGVGIYRQQVFDKNSNLIWDVTTTPSGTGGSGPTATGDGDAVGTIKPWAGPTAPNQYMFTYGQALNRITYAPLFQAITSIQNTTCVSGSPIISGLSDTNSFWIGMSVELSCVAGGVTTVTAKTPFTVTLAANANANGIVAATFFLWGNGNGSITFNLPDYRGLIPMGNNIMGGVASSNISDANFGSQSASSAGAQGGAQTNSTTLLLANLPPITPAGTITNGTLSFPSVSIGSAGGGGTNAFTTGGFSATGNMTSAMGTVSQSATTFAGSVGGGSSTPFTTIRIQPSKTVNFIIKVTPDTAASGTGVTSLGGMTGDIVCGAGLTCAGATISTVATGGTVTQVTPGNGLVSSITSNCSQTAIVSNGTLSASQCVNAQTGTSYVIADSDRAKLITGSNTLAQAYTIPQAGAASSFVAGWTTEIRNIQPTTQTAAIISLTPTTSTVCGGSSVNIYPGGSLKLVSDGTNYLCPFQLLAQTITNSLGSDTALNNTANYFDGPSVAQSTVGGWWAAGTVTLNDASAASFFCKLWDGTTVIASAAASTSAGFNASISLSGYILNPVANIKISCRDVTNTTGNIKFNTTGTSKDSTLTVNHIQ